MPGDFKFDSTLRLFYVGDGLFFVQGNSASPIRAAIVSALEDR